MKPRITYWLGVVLLGIAATASAAPVSSRQVLSADFDWKFALGDTAGAEATGFDDASWRVVQLPHDWSIESAPDQKNPTQGGGGFFPSGVGWYRKTFQAPAAWKQKRVSVEFDGIYRNATVYLNGEKLGMRPSGYSSVSYELTPHLAVGGRNVLAVRVDTSAQPNSRWYSGSGIYRHVRVVVTDPVHVGHWGVFVTTPELSATSAKVVVRTVISNETGNGSDVVVETSIVGPAGTPEGHARAPQAAAVGDTEVTQEITVAHPTLWSPQTPRLYKAISRVLRGGTVVDEVTTPFGIRSIGWSAEKGFLLNGTPMELTGGSVHHDNGPLGAAAFDRAEARRVELLKAAGFNAVRTAHNAPSPAFLDACDRLGLLVLDEPFDVWTIGKAKYDMAHQFDEWWQRDVAALVLRDRNHPSIVLWGIGNEIPEGFMPEGGPLGKKIADYVRTLDTSRPLTQAFPGATYTANVDATMANVDIAGYNYNIAGNQAKDHARVPSRIIVTTESFPRSAFKEWQLAHQLPYAIGEFVWTAIDYLGESGIGGATFGTPEAAAKASNFLKMLGSGGMSTMGADGKNPFPPADQTPEEAAKSPFASFMSFLFVGWPYHAAVCGDIDLIGDRKPWSHYRDILWNRGDRVYAAVRVPAPAGQALIETLWAVKPTIQSWTWPGREGSNLEVEVYAGTERVRLLLNDKVIGEQPTGEAQEFKALFTVPYAPGTLKAVGLNGDRVVAESVLTTSGAPARLRLTEDHATLAADGQDLAFVVVEALDASGRPQLTANHEVQFTLSGPGTIAAVGNGDGTSTEPYVGTSRKLFNGRALVVVRATRQAGSIQLKAAADGLEAASATLTTRPAAAAARLQ
jgi:beta-galactosidase